MKAWPIVVIGVLVAVCAISVAVQGRGFTNPFGMAHHDVRFDVVMLDSSTSSRFLQRVEDVLDQPITLRGVDANVLHGEHIRVKLVSGLPSNVDAAAYPTERIIAIAAAANSDQSVAWIRATIRHELSHIALALALDYAYVPRWVDEGFAEWQNGGVSCEGDLRLRVYRMMLSDIDTWPSIESGIFPTNARITYDLFASVFEYIQARWPAALVDGDLIGAIRARGFNAGLKASLGVDLHELSTGWQRHLGTRDTVLSGGRGCGDL